MRQRNDGENVACVMKRQNGKSADGLSCSSNTDKRPIDDDVEEEAMFVEKFAFALLHFSAGVSASALPTDLHLPHLSFGGSGGYTVRQCYRRSANNLELAAGARAEVAHESWTNSLSNVENFFLPGRGGGASIPSTRQGIIVPHVASL